jgi:hypothetical protein
MLGTVKKPLHGCGMTTAKYLFLVARTNDQ